MNFAHFEAVHDDTRIDPVIVCHLAQPLAAALGARRGRVLLSHATVQKQRLHHPDLTLNDYRVLKPALMMGEYRQDTPRSAIVIFTDGVFTGETYRGAIKSTQDGRCLFCVSFCLVRGRKITQLQRRISALPLLREHD